MESFERFSNFIDEKQLFKKQDRILLAVSGGKDSVFMATLFSQSKFAYAIAHCNFQLRGEDANQDQVFVQQLAQELNVPYYDVRFDTEDYAKANQISIQMAARDLRYEWLEGMREIHAYDYIAVGHHETDSIETVLINMVRGTGISGLHGILPKRNKIVRPILAFTAAEVAAYIERNNISYREDRSNKETKYTRNKIRLKVLPVLKTINPDLEATLSLASRRFHSLELFLEKQINQIREAIFIERAPEVYEISIDELKENTTDPFVLFELFKPFLYSEAVLSDLSLHLNQESSGKLFYSKSHQLLIDRGNLILRKKSDQVEESIEIMHLPAEFTWNGVGYRVLESSDITLSNQIKQVKLDEDLVSFPIKVRSWKAGDIFMPLGLNGKKKVSDFLINQKVALDQKNKIPLFVNANNDILYVAPFRIDDRYKITSKTKKVIIFEQL